ncbi:MAG: aldo/keto reductase [Steroidobacteraceae bacterium]
MFADAPLIGKGHGFDVRDQSRHGGDLRPPSPHRALGAHACGRRGASAATVALAWQIARPNITAPIASATTVNQLREMIAATELNLDQAALERLNAAGVWGHGHRLSNM